MNYQVGDLLLYVSRDTGRIIDTCTVTARPYKWSATAYSKTAYASEPPDIWLRISFTKRTDLDGDYLPHHIDTWLMTPKEYEEKHGQQIPQRA